MSTTDYEPDGIEHEADHAALRIRAAILRAMVRDALAEESVR